MLLILLGLQEWEEGTGKDRGGDGAMDHPASEYSGKVREQNVRAMEQTVRSISSRDV